LRNHGNALRNFRVGVRYAYRLDYHNGRVQPFLAFNF
jgi:hypothetical protein